MKLLVLSDSHGMVEPMAQAVETTKPDMILHLGDVMRDGQRLHELFPDIPFEQVPGNCDLGATEQAEKILFVEDKRVLMCHGHTLHVKDTLILAEDRAHELNADLFLFGHTHKIYAQTHNGVAMLNPGSIGDHFYPTYGVAEIVKGNIIIGTVPLNGYPSR
jgi:hypothetical protein